MVWLYALILLLLAAALVVAYRVLGAPDAGERERQEPAGTRGRPPTDGCGRRRPHAGRTEAAGDAGRASRKYRTVASRPASRLVFGCQPRVFSIFRASTTERRCSPGRGGPCSSG